MLGSTAVGPIQGGSTHWACFLDIMSQPQAPGFTHCHLCTGCSMLSWFLLLSPAYQIKEKDSEALWRPRCAKLCSCLRFHGAELLHFCSSSTQSLPEVPDYSMRRPDPQGSYLSCQLLPPGKLCGGLLQIKLSRDKIQKGSGRLP